MNVSFVNASVAYSRRNGTILSYQPVGTLQPANVPSHEIITALHSAFGNFSDGLESLLPILSQPEKLILFPLYAYPVYIWGFLEGAKNLASSDPEFAARGHDTLASILAMVMYFGQPSVYAQALMTMNLTKGDSTTNASVIQALSSDLAATAPPDVPIHIANLKFQIVVGKGTLMGYVALSSLTLLICFFLLVYSMITPGAARVPRTTSFPLWNIVVNCNIDAMNAMPESPEDCLRLLTSGEMVHAAKRVGIRLAY